MSSAVNPFPGMERQGQASKHRSSSFFDSFRTKHSQPRSTRTAQSSRPSRLLRFARRNRRARRRSTDTSVLQRTPAVEPFLPVQRTHAKLLALRYVVTRTRHTQPPMRTLDPRTVPKGIEKSSEDELRDYFAQIRGVIT